MLSFKRQGIHMYIYIYVYVNNNYKYIYVSEDGIFKNLKNLQYLMNIIKFLINFVFK